MRKLLILLIILIESCLFAGTKKISELTRTDAPGDSTMFIITWDSSGTYVTRRMNWYYIENNVLDSLLENSATTEVLYNSSGSIESNSDFTYDGTSVTFGNKILIPNGSAASPAIEFANDTGNGIYLFGADQIGITINGVFKHLFSSSGVLLSGNVSINNGTIAGQTEYQEICVYIPSPSSISQDSLWFWENTKGTTVTIDSIIASADVDDQDITIVKRLRTGGAPTIIDALTVSTDGTDVYTTKETTLTTSTIESHYELGIPPPSEASTWVRIVLFINYVDQR
jgi:hypothetical protein